MSEDLTKGSVARSLLSFTIPLVLSGLLQQLFNWVDAFIVGNINGEAALAGIGATSSIYNLFVMLITGFTSGLSVLVAQKAGEGDEEASRDILSTYGVVLTAIFLVIALVGAAMTNPILSLMDTPQDIFTEAGDYLRLIFLGIPFLALYNVYGAVLRGLGNSRAPFLAILVSSIANVILDIIFVAFLGWGTAGAALATVIAQGAMTVFIVLYTFTKSPALRHRPGRGRSSAWALRQGGIFGLPPAVQSGVSSVGNVVLQQFMNGFGAQTVAAITTAYRVDTVILLPIVNLGSGIATVVAQNTGSRNEERSRATLRTGLVMMTVVSLVLTAVVFLFGSHLIALFGLEAGTVAIGDAFFKRIAAFYIVYGFAMAFRGALEGRGDMLYSGFAGILFLVVRIIGSYAMDDIFGNMVIAWAEAFAWIFLLFEFIVRYHVKTRRTS